MPQDDGTIGGRLRELRLWRHMTLAEVAGLAGVTPAYLSMAERGLRTRLISGASPRGRNRAAL